MKGIWSQTCVSQLLAWEEVVYLQKTGFELQRRLVMCLETEWNVLAGETAFLMSLMS